MRIPAAQARAIARHAARTLHVPVDPRLIPPLRPATRHSSRPFRAEVGDLLPIHGGQRVWDADAGKWRWRTEVTVYASVDAVTIRELGHLTLEEAQAAGFESPDAFEVAWVERQERGWLDEQIRILTEAGSPDAAETRDEWARQRYAPRWSQRQVWIIDLTPIHDMPRLLADEHGVPKGDTGYVHFQSAALDDEPEAIDGLRLARAWAEHAEVRRCKAQDEHLEERLARCMSVEERLAVVRTEAKRQGRDIRTHLRAIDRRLDDLVRRLSADERDAA